jgi:DNA invertase Pin-like site-specific DNA recombinase
VSGNVPMWDRPEAGPWINDAAKRTQYDGFVFAALDRLGRNARHIAAMRDWAEDHGKKLIITSPPLQWPPADNDLASPIIWDVLSRLAEYELKAITKRNRETQAYLKANGFLVGRYPYGYMIVPKGDNKTLDLDPMTSPNVDKIFNLRCEGKTYQQIADYLNAQGVLTVYDLYAAAKGKAPKGSKWDRGTVRQIIMNPIYKGSRMSGRRNGSGGSVVLRVPQIVDAATWRKAQLVSETASLAQKGRRTSDKALLAGVIKCGVCGRNMSRIRDSHGEQRYYCHGPKSGPRCRVSVSLADAEAYIAAQVAGFGDEPHMVSVLTPGDVNTDEIDATELQLRSLDLDDPDYDEKHAALRAERQRLIKLDAEAETPSVEWVPSRKADGTLKTVGEEWAERDQDGKREWLLDRGGELQVIRDRGVDSDGKRTNIVLYSINWRNWWKNQPQAT